MQCSAALEDANRHPECSASAFSDAARRAAATLPAGKPQAYTDMPALVGSGWRYMTISVGVDPEGLFT